MLLSTRLTSKIDMTKDFESVCLAFPFYHNKELLWMKAVQHLRKRRTNEGPNNTETEIYTVLLNIT